MPSQLHDVLVRLFHNRPRLAGDLLRRVLKVELPRFTDASIESSELTEVQPTEYRADLVVSLKHKGTIVAAVVVEVQLWPNNVKRFSWPQYTTSLRARIRAPVLLMVIAVTERMTRWCSRRIDLGGGNYFTPLVFGPSAVPLVTDAAVAKREPELAVLSAMAHGKQVDPETELKVALAAIGASAQLDEERSMFYFDLVVASLSEAARGRLQAMDPAKYEYQSDFAKHFIAQGEAKGRSEGEARGLASGLLKQLRLKFGQVSDDTVARVQSASIEELDRWVERILNATSIDDTLR